MMDAIVSFLREVWRHEEPFRCYDPELADRVLDQQLERSVGRLGEAAGFVAHLEGDLAGAVLLEPSYEPMDPQTLQLSWLAVGNDDRNRGVASALLAAAVELLADAGHTTLHSGTSAANVPSLRWHWTHGFTLLPDPLGFARRPRRTSAA